jgi:hypothetical protein
MEQVSPQAERSFAPFTLLPPELQDHIWDLATPSIAPGLYLVDIDADRHNRTYFRRRSVIWDHKNTPRAVAILTASKLRTVCRGSRDAVDRCITPQNPLRLEREPGSFTSTSMPSASLPALTVDGETDLILVNLKTRRVPFQLRPMPYNGSASDTLLSVRHLGIARDDLEWHANPLRLTDEMEGRLHHLLECVGHNVTDFYVVAGRLDPLPPLSELFPDHIASSSPPGPAAQSAGPDSRIFRAGGRAYHQVPPETIDWEPDENIFSAAFALVKKHRVQQDGPVAKAPMPRCWVLLWANDT